MSSLVPGRFSIGTAAATIVYAPFTIPAAPNPEIARPAIKARLVGAEPHTNEPASKRAKKARNVYYTGTYQQNDAVSRLILDLLALTLKRAYSLPVSG